MESRAMRLTSGTCSVSCTSCPASLSSRISSWLRPCGSSQGGLNLQRGAVKGCAHSHTDARLGCASSHANLRPMQALHLQLRLELLAQRVQHIALRGRGHMTRDKASLGRQGSTAGTCMYVIPLATPRPSPYQWAPSGPAPSAHAAPHARSWQESSKVWQAQGAGRTY